jgi:hypothetical protein
MRKEVGVKEGACESSSGHKKSTMLETGTGENPLSVISAEFIGVAL